MISSNVPRLIISCHCRVVIHFEQHLSVLPLRLPWQLALLLIHIPKYYILELFDDEGDWVIRLVQVHAHLNKYGLQYFVYVAQWRSIVIYIPDFLYVLVDHTEHRLFCFVEQV